MQNRRGIVIFVTVFVAAGLLASILLTMGCGSAANPTRRASTESTPICRDRAEPGFMDVKSRIAILEGIEADPAEIAAALAKCLAKEGRIMAAPICTAVRKR